MTLEELSVQFSADISPFSQAMSALSGIISSAGAQADTLPGQFHSAGMQAGAGLASGISAQRGTVTAAARAVAQAAAAALRAALQIHSPSKLTYEAGTLFDEGLAQGISASASQAESEAARLGLDTAEALQMPQVAAPIASIMPARPAEREEDAQDALSRLSITVPLEIDSYRLGVAAIEGINRVNQGSGRVELNF